MIINKIEYRKELSREIFEGRRFDLEYVIKTFSTRELAAGLWIAIAFVFCMIWSKTRESLRGVVKCAFCKQFNSLYVSAIGYTVLMIYILYLLGYWEWFLFKDSILAMIFVALVPCFKIISNKDRIGFLKELIIDAIKWTVVIQFITSTYTFNFFIEFVVLFIIVFIGILRAFADRDENSKAVVKFCDFFLIIYGLISIIFSLSKVVQGFNEFIKIDTLKTFLLPIIMLLLYIPFIYEFAMHCLYQEISIRLKTVVKNDKKLLRYFKFKIRLKYCFRLCKLESFRTVDMLMRGLFTSKQDIDNFFNDIN